MIEFTRLNHIHLQATKDGLVAARTFYGKQLGLKEQPLPPEFGANPPVLWFRLMNFDLHVRFTENRQAISHGIEIAQNPPSHICLEIKNSKEVRMKLEKEGCEIRDGYPFKDRCSFFVADPFGNLFELIEFY